MAKFGYSLYCEGFAPQDLVKQAVMAEDAGFDFLVISDHYHPWLTSQSHAGFAWSILGAVAQATQRIRLATMVTCPIMRYHPAIIAQAAATISVLSQGRFTLGLGAGERLNEHIVGKGWPSVTVRHKALREAIEIIKLLFAGGFHSFDGRYFKLDDARIFDLPDEPIDFFVGAGGIRAAALSAAMGGGICVTAPKKRVIEVFKENGGESIWGQAILSWDKSESGGLETAHKQFRFSAGGWAVQSELPNPMNFDAATENVRPEDLAETIPAGPDAKKHVAVIQNFLDAGVENLALVYPGDNTEGFMKFWQEELRPQLGEVTAD